MFSDGFQSPREEQGKEDHLKTTCLLGGSLNTLWGKGHRLVGFLEGEVWTEATPRARALGWNFYPSKALLTRMCSTSILTQSLHECMLLFSRYPHLKPQNYHNAPSSFSIFGI